MKLSFIPLVNFLIDKYKTKGPVVEILELLIKT